MRKHKMAIRQRTVDEHVCASKSCEFYGKPAVQGVCHSDRGLAADFAKLDKLDAEITAELKSLKRREGKGYVKALESYYITASMNWTLVTDELVRLRRNLALATGKKVRK